MPERISFKDPDGFVFSSREKYYRVVFRSFSDDLALIEKAGILNEPALVAHTKVTEPGCLMRFTNWISTNYSDQEILAIFEIEKLECITYPWEWTPTMLRDAALLTLQLQEKLARFGLSLKDASFFNVQFVNSQPVFIDLLSVKKTGTVYPWFAYGQFLSHFVYPLMLIKYGKLPEPSVLWSFHDGIDVKTVKRLLPGSSFFSLYELINVHLLSMLPGNAGTTELNKTRIKAMESRLNQLLSFNRGYLQKIKPGKGNGHRYNWENYYEDPADAGYQSVKEEKVAEIVRSIDKRTRCLDLGANTGKYSTLLLEYFNEVISVEQDINCCEQIRRNMVAARPDDKDKKWTVINADLLSPTPAIGWMNKERKSLLDRIVSPVVVSLALIHHLYFRGSIDFEQITCLFNQLSEKYVIIEFVGREDEKVKLLSGLNPTRYLFYAENNFLKEMSRYFIFEKQILINQNRTLYFFSKKA